MAISIFDLFKIGIGPSSSHTVGPMVAANLFLEGLQTKGNLGAVASISVDLYGSLGATGKGHGSGKAVMLGLMGEKPDEVDVESVQGTMEEILETKKINLAGMKIIDFDYDEDITFHRKKSLPFHANGMMITACDAGEDILYDKIYYSVGGGFVVDDSERDQITSPIKQNDTVLPHPFTTGDELLALCKEKDLSISEVMMANESVWNSEEVVREKLLKIWQVMQDCVTAGCKNTGILPGGLKVKRRAAELCHSLENELTHEQYNQGSMDWVNLFALAVNEENAAGGRVVTAPTNGAAGIIPALLHYYVHFCRAYKQDGDDGIVRFLLTAAAIGIIIKENASISGAEVGCQGEIGSACAMAAAGLTEVLGGTPMQIENAAEIGLEHNLGLTCDPIGGLVQVPCIERNAMGSVKAINASRMALRGNGEHFVSFDKAVITMRETGRDMATKYKETSRGGLAIQVIEVPVNIVEC
ncbi:MAG: L-serine ammonia-lyase [Cocleimonas sp.]